MRGADAMQESLFTVAKLDDFVPEDHPLRGIRLLVNAALAEMHGRFDEIYAPGGRDSIAPEKLIRALLLQVFSIRSERQLLRTAALQLAVPLVCGTGHRRSGLGSLDLFEEPRPAAAA